tara:strand:- start:10356 stop:11729 length:1374 start_codon:yes stop_codon:yes gene_type:complete
MNTLINISGASGVGKTTISTMISLILSNLNSSVLSICGDDLHKWERGNENWTKYTHFNPEANNLSLGEDHIATLLAGSTINRDHYDHTSGKFIKDVLIKPESVIINEGLHSLYSEAICEMAELNIFVETENDLKNQWKLNRDMEKRGYTRDQVISSIGLRKIDEAKYILPQKRNANVVVKFSEMKDKSVQLTYTAATKYGQLLMQRIKAFYELHRNFLLTCRKSCFEYELIQGAGGNLSYKFEDKIVITSSGRSMPDISILNGFTMCNDDGTKVNSSQDRPSMELGFHTKLASRVVYHTHPIYANIILCSNEAKMVMADILHSFDYDYIEYITPGMELCNKLASKKDIVLLENHGLICCSESFEEAFSMSLQINQLCKEWLIKNSKTFKTFGNKVTSKNSDRILYPDAAILPEANLQINNYMLQIQEEVGLTSKYISRQEIEKLKNMEEEKYRMELI